MKSRNNLQQKITVTQAEMNQLADRALILLSFKDTDTQNLRFIMNLLGIRTLKEKQEILKEIFRLIRRGFVYVPDGLIKLVEHRSHLRKKDLKDIEDIDLCLLCPYEKLIQEIQKEISKIREQDEKANS